MHAVIKINQLFIELASGEFENTNRCVVVMTCDEAITL
jgi:hypothetical protein